MILLKLFETRIQEFSFFDQVLAIGTAELGCEAARASKLEERYSWNVLDFAFPDEISRQEALASGAFVPENNLPVGLEIWNNKVFVTVPRWRSGESRPKYIL